MAKKRPIGQRVRIDHTSGISEFHGKAGTIIGTENMGGSDGAYYRVRLDEPVHIDGIGLVTDDLWQGPFLKTIAPKRPQTNKRSLMAGLGLIQVRGALGGIYYE